MYDKQILPANYILNSENYQYCIEKVLGQGSFGITYLAKIKSVNSLGNLQTDVKVVIKEFFMKDVSRRYGDNVLAENDTSSYINYRRNFKHGAYNLSKLNHPNIVKILDYFEDNNTLYYSMEYIGDETLNDHIQAHVRLSEKESLESICQIIDALSYMHANKVLHLDLKPHNIMRRENGDLVLIDFGLSKRFNSEYEPEFNVHIGGGTIGYAPLEQFDFEKGICFSPTLDIYALGGILYKMLTGFTPPDASSILNDGFPKDSMIEQGISQDVISITKWAMEPIIRNRPQRVVEFLNVIKRILPYVSNIYKNTPTKMSILSNEPTVETYEICNNFHVHWSNNVTEFEKQKIRYLLKSMRRIETIHKHETNNTTMFLGDRTWEHLYPIIIGENTHGYFPQRTIRFILNTIQQLSYCTGLQFRLSNEDEIIYQHSASDEYWKNLKTLCYSKNNKLQYKTYGKNGCLNDIRSFYEWNMETYDIQLVCDGLKPFHDIFSFDTSCGKDLFDEILPIGFNLYKVRNGILWNIKSPQYPTFSYLSNDCHDISNIGIWQIPRGGGIYEYFGIKTKIDDITSYYSFSDGRFKLLEMLSDSDIEERKKWT